MHDENDHLATDFQLRKDEAKRAIIGISSTGRLSLNSVAARSEYYEFLGKLRGGKNMLYQRAIIFKATMSKVYKCKTLY